MTHIIIMAEGYVDALNKFEEYFHGRQYAGGKAKVRMRKVQLYTSSVNLVGRDEFLADLKGFGADIDNNGKFFRLARWLRRMFLPFGLKKVDWSKIECSGLRGAPGQFSKKGEGCVSFNGHFVVLGEYPDFVFDEQCNWGNAGEELV